MSQTNSDDKTEKALTKQKLIQDTKLTQTELTKKRPYREHNEKHQNITVYQLDEETQGLNMISEINLGL
jgi:hypothetical protein